MGYETGFAADQADLLSKAKTFLESAPAGSWVTDRYVSTSGSEELIIHGVGAGTDEIYVGMKCFADAATDNYAWILQGFTGFNNSLSFHQQPGAITSYYPALPLSKVTPSDSNNLKYWFVANSRRFICVVKVGSTYQQSYLGWILPYGLPTQWPYPLLVGGSTYYDSNAFSANYNKPYRYSIADHRVATFWKNRPLDNNVGQACLREPGGTYRRFMNFVGGSDSFKSTGTWPYIEELKDDYNGFIGMKPTLDGKYTLQPIIYCDGGTENIYGELDGMKHTTGFGNSAENIIEIGSDDWLAVPNVFRNGQSEFAAVKLV